jgi:glycosyltransferase involved in cell wall biosynthesis
MAHRVLHVIPAVAARYGGPSAAVIGMSRALAVAGWSVLVATTDADGDSRLPVPIGQVTDHQGVATIFYPRTASEAYKWSPALATWLKARASDFDLVHVHSVFSHSSIAAGRACRASGVPYIVRPLGTLDPWSLTRRRLAKRVLLGTAVRRLLSGATCLHYTSAEEQRLAETAVRRLPRGVVVPLGVDDTLFAVARDPREAASDVLLSMGRLDPKKGIDLLIDAFHAAIAAPGHLGDWRLVIAGSGADSYVAHLKARAAGGAASGRIEFSGWIAGDQKAALLRSAAVFVLPSLQENFAIAVAEAMACGVPAIVSPAVNLAPEIEREGAGWVAARDIRSLSAVIARACEDEAGRARRGLAAQRVAERFRWPVVARELGAMYDGARAERGAAGGAVAERVGAL